MGSVSTEPFREEQQQQLKNTDNALRMERAKLVLSSPDPPGLWHELVGSIKETIFPKRNTISSSKPSRSMRVFSFLQGLFPILSWGRNYKASKFKNDLMAGLTIASLSIPQV